MSTPQDLSHSELAGRNFTQAKMFGADLTESDLRSANLHGADLTGADLTEAKLDNVTWPKGWKLVRDE
jgi:uncharacterized protein YjbI with pentapeptide repeats